MALNTEQALYVQYESKVDKHEGNAFKIQDADVQTILSKMINR